MLGKIFVQLSYLFALGDQFLGSTDLIGFTWRSTIWAFLGVLFSIWLLGKILGGTIQDYKAERSFKRNLKFKQKYNVGKSTNKKGS